MPVEKWRALCGAPDNDPALAPDDAGTRPGGLERYFNDAYSLISDVQVPRGPGEGLRRRRNRIGGHPITLFLIGFVSRQFGPLLVIRGKMPAFPRTFEGEDGRAST